MGQQGVGTVAKIVAALLLTVVTSNQGLLVGFSKNAAGRYDYNVATVPLLAEFVKLCISGVMLMWTWGNTGGQVQVTVGWGTLYYVIPSIIYLVNHNLTFACLRYVTPSTYQLLGNLKIISTSILCRVLLKRRLSVLKWIAIFLLLVGTTTSQLEGQSTGGSSFNTSGSQWSGYMLGVLMAFLSGTAGVYSELLMKKLDDNIHWQNLQMYGWGMLVNGIRLSFSVGGAVPGGMLAGYDYRAVMCVLNLALSGLLVSFLLKYADSIAKVFSTAMAMFLTPIVSVFLFRLYPNPPLLVGAFTASISLVLFYAIEPKHTVVDIDGLKEAVSREEKLLAETKMLRGSSGVDLADQDEQSAHV